MKEMEYSKKSKREVLDSGYCMGFFYYILNLGTHPTAYIKIPENHKYYGKDYGEIDIDVHGGLTYAHDYLYIDDTTKVDGWFIGWDYAHWGDYMGYFEDENWQQYHQFEDDKKWTTQEIKEEVASVCYQLAEINEEENDG